MDNHEEEKEPLIKKTHAAGGGANLTAGLNAPNCRWETLYDELNAKKLNAPDCRRGIVATNTRDEQAAMDKYGITFDGKTYNVEGRKFAEYKYALKCADPNACIPKPATPNSWWGYIKNSGVVLGTLALGGIALFIYAGFAVLALVFIFALLTRNLKD